MTWSDIVWQQVATYEALVGRSEDHHPWSVFFFSRKLHLGSLVHFESLPILPVPHLTIEIQLVRTTMWSQRCDFRLDIVFSLILILFGDNLLRQ